MPERKKCPPFCEVDTCEVVHHKLIVSLINIQEGDRKSFDRFRGKLELYRNSICPEDPIMDPIREYRHPLLHWASVLGKVSAVEYLVNLGYQPDIRSPEKGETALHRVVLCLYRSMERYSAEKQIKRFRNLTDLLAPALFVQDDNGNTPLHSCAVYITNYLTEAQGAFYRLAFRVMVEKVVEMEERGLSKTDGLNVRNKEGKTALHILASSKLQDCIELVRELLKNGADPEIQSFDGKSASDVGGETSKKMAAELYEHKRIKRTHQPCLQIEMHGENSKASKCQKPSSFLPSKKFKHSIDQNHVSSTTSGNLSECDESESGKIKKHMTLKRKLGVKPSLVSGETTTNIVSSQVEQSGTSVLLCKEQNQGVSGTSGAASPCQVIKQEHMRKEIKNVQPSTSGSTLDVQKPNSPSTTPRLEQLLKKTNQHEIVLKSVEEQRKQLEVDCLKSDKVLEGYVIKSNNMKTECLWVEKEIKAKEEELEKLKNRLLKRRHEVTEIDAKISEEEAKRVKIADELANYQNIISLFQNVTES